jgi:hypothetical protein
MTLPGRVCCGAAALMVLTFCGCGPAYSPEAHRVDPVQARSTLEAVLTGWQQGETPDAWQQKSPAVVVQDMEWKAGAKLTAFEIVSTEAVDANLHCQVKLALEDPQKGKVEKTVKYLVTTSPVLTVFRAFE